jgi:hypothetical protein
MLSGLNTPNIGGNQPGQNISTQSVSVSNIGGNQSRASALFAEIISVIQKIVSSNSALAMFHPKTALEWVSMLPPNHYETGHVLSIIARCYFELQQYQKSSEFFQKLRYSFIN